MSKGYGQHTEPADFPNPPSSGVHVPSIPVTMGDVTDSCVSEPMEIPSEPTVESKTCLRVMGAYAAHEETMGRGHLSVDETF
eukprot:1392075-Amorphochlora_amoeboformis.AAC.1